MTAPEWVLIITTVTTGIVSIITAIKTERGNKKIDESHKKLEEEIKPELIEAKERAIVSEVKIDSIAKSTNGELTRVIAERDLLKVENARLLEELNKARADLIGLSDRKSETR